MLGLLELMRNPQDIESFRCESEITRHTHHTRRLLQRPHRSWMIAIWQGRQWQTPIFLFSWSAQWQDDFSDQFNFRARGHQCLTLGQFPWSSPCAACERTKLYQTLKLNPAFLTSENSVNKVTHTQVVLPDPVQLMAAVGLGRRTRVECTFSRTCSSSQFTKPTAGHDTLPASALRAPASFPCEIPTCSLLDTCTVIHIYIMCKNMLMLIFNMVFTNIKKINKSQNLWVFEDCWKHIGNLVFRLQ